MHYSVIKFDYISWCGLSFPFRKRMEEDERREALEDAGLNPDDYDFD